VSIIWLSDQTYIIFPYIIDRLVFVTHKKCVYCAQGNEYLIKI